MMGSSNDTSSQNSNSLILVNFSLPPGWRRRATYEEPYFCVWADFQCDTEGSSSIHHTKIQETIASNLIFFISKYYFLPTPHFFFLKRDCSRERTASVVPKCQGSDLTGLPGCYCSITKTIVRPHYLCCNCLCSCEDLRN